MKSGACFTGPACCPPCEIVATPPGGAVPSLAAALQHRPVLGVPACSKRQLLQHLQTTRQQLQRLHVCAQWAHKAKAVNTCREVLKASQDHGTAFVHAGVLPASIPAAVASVHAVLLPTCVHKRLQLWSCPLLRLPAADELFRLHEELRFSRVPLFDVSTALHIMQTGMRCSN